MEPGDRVSVDRAAEVRHKLAGRGRELPQVVADGIGVHEALDDCDPAGPTDALDVVGAEGEFEGVAAVFSRDQRCFPLTHTMQEVFQLES